MDLKQDIKNFLSFGLVGVLYNRVNKDHFNNTIIADSIATILVLVTFVLLFVLFVFMMFYKVTGSLFHAIMFMVLGPIWFYIAFFWWYLNNYKVLATERIKIKHSSSSK